nr:AzlD domain-containing protein [Nocardioides flavescens]
MEPVHPARGARRHRHRRPAHLRPRRGRRRRVPRPAVAAAGRPPGPRDRRAGRGGRDRRRAADPGRCAGAGGGRGRPARRAPDTRPPTREEADVIWAAVLGAGVGCYLLKLAGLSVPPQVLEQPLVSRVADLIPVALLAALVAVQVLADGSRLVLDERAAGLGAAVVLLVLRAPFLVVVAGAALTAALLRLVGG